MNVETELNNSYSIHDLLLWHRRLGDSAYIHIIFHNYFFVSSTGIPQRIMQTLHLNLPKKILRSVNNGYTVFPLWCIIYRRTSLNSNSDGSNCLLIRTKFPFPWSKFHWNLAQQLEFLTNLDCFSFPFRVGVTEVLQYLYNLLKFNLKFFNPGWFSIFFVS